MTLKRFCLLSLITLLALAPASSVSADGDLVLQLREVRRATARFHSVTQAEKAGYGQFLTCVSEPGQGAMGIHFVNGGLIGDTVLDPLWPEAIMYEPQPDGSLRLVGVEYIVFQAAWDAEHDERPSLFGHEFHLVGFPNRYDVPAFYELHAWVWKLNPSGVFNDWNSRVHCP
jgi:hypothetical protein